MIQLMKLELRKNKISTYFKGVALCSIMGICFTALFIVIMAVEKETENDFKGFMDFIMLPDVMMRAIFIVYSGLILNRLVIDEYRDKTILLMYTYPIERKKLFLAKLILTFFGTIISLFVCTSLLTGVTALILSKMNLFTDVTFANYVKNLQLTLLGAITCGFASLIPFFFGIRKKSMPATIGSSTIIAALISSTGSSLNPSNDAIRLLVIMGISVVFVLFGLNGRINRLEESDV